MPKKLANKSLKRGKSIHELERRTGNKEPRKYLLIVVEGQETEYNYFCALKRDMRLQTTKVEVISTSGGDPLVTVDKAHDLVQEKKQESKRTGELEYDEVFCVFDEDNKPEKYKEALLKAQGYNFICITSIPCFEFWFLLHYCYTTSPFTSCNHLVKKLETEQRNLCILKKGEYYDKSNIDLYKILKPKLTDALAHAARLDKQHQNSDGCTNPSTKVHILVKKLQDQKNFG
ncbi:RloB family protein [Chlorogloeopsis sp. ULAP02]|uniref:RloB family protein n=1 Tax=Chlorogloeopsis sp. ULAP02 TaxID=3107926 RepID=UPI003135DBE2